MEALLCLEDTEKKRSRCSVFKVLYPEKFKRYHPIVLGFLAVLLVLDTVYIKESQEMCAWMKEKDELDFFQREIKTLLYTVGGIIEYVSFCA